MNAIVHQEKILDKIHIEDLYEHEQQVGSKPGLIDNPPQHNTSIRSVKIKAIHYFQYPDVCQRLVSLVKHFGLDPEKHEIREFNYLIYRKGDHFKKHSDNINCKRVLTSITLLSYMREFTGGSLLVYDKGEDKEPTRIDLEYGETVTFLSEIFHEVEIVTSGTRRALIAWIYEKE